MAEKFDLIFSLGSIPIVSDIIKKRGLQIFDFPFDSTFGADYFTRMNLVLTNFDNFLEKENFILENNVTNKKPQYKDSKTNIVFQSNFNSDIALEQEYFLLKKQYNKYIKHLKLSINKAKRILIVYVENPIIKEDDDTTSSLVAQSIERFKDKYPDKDFRILYIKNNDKDYENMQIIQIGSNAEKMIFNFYKRFSETSSYFIDISTLEIALTDIKLNTTMRQKKIIFLQKLVNKLSMIR